LKTGPLPFGEGKVLANAIVRFCGGGYEKRRETAENIKEKERKIKKIKGEVKIVK
jgi:hypothetical protein